MVTPTPFRHDDAHTRAEAGRALVVDDDSTLLRSYTRMLESHGFEVHAAHDGHSAMAILQSGAFDVVVSDIDMPEMSGVELLQRVRQHDLDIPVVIITGNPSLETATQAIEQGALRYLVKPVAWQAIVQVTGEAVKLHRLARAKRQALDLAGGFDRLVGDRAGLIASFTRALDSLHMAYQPIVDWPARTIFGYEALLRSHEPSLPHPGAVIDAAERLNRLEDLGRTVRSRASEPALSLADDLTLFVNLHPRDLLDDELLSPAAPLARIAHRVILEITERASLHDIADVQSRVAKLRSLGYRIALDDLGAGYAGLTSFALLEPEVVKLDMSLVRDIDRQPTKRTLVRTMVSMCKELGKRVVAEGVETATERDVLTESGCSLMQGYLFARPGAPFPTPRW